MCVVRPVCTEPSHRHQAQLAQGLAAAVITVQACAPGPCSESGQESQAAQGEEEPHQEDPRYQEGTCYRVWMQVQTVCISYSLKIYQWQLA